MKNIFKKLTALSLCVLMCAAIPMSVFATPDYWGFDDYETIVNPDCDEITSYPTTLTKVSNSEYTMVSQTDGLTVTITFEEMKWGTFNLWEWYVTEANGTKHSIVGGSTDLEYVHRTAKTASGAQIFTGGNHGNEALISLDFYNGETGAKISLTNGQSVNINKLHIIEKTKLLWFPDANNDSIGDYNDKSMSYTDADVFAEVTRKYTVTGPQVKLNVDYKYTQNAYHGISYTCMFPVSKTYGRYADMYDKDGKFIKTVATNKLGSASDNMNNGNKATRAIIYGDDYSQYQFDVYINTFKDSLSSQDNTFLTAFWDMNAYSNKLYFSRHNTTPTLYTAGAESHTECVWRFNYDADGRKPTESGEIPSEPENNLARGKEYKISLTNANPGDGVNTSYAADLTDGIASTGFNMKNDSWFAFNAYKPNIIDGVGSVTVNLGAEYEITSLRAHLFNNVAGMGVKAPKAASAYAIVDGEEVKLCDLTGISAEDTVAYWVSGESKGIVTDTVIFKFTLDGAFMYINEIEVQGNEISDPPVDPETKTYALGDINMDGTVNQYDYILAKRAHFNTITLNDNQKLLGDMDENGKNNQYDYILVKRIHFKNYSTDKTVEIEIG